MAQLVSVTTGEINKTWKYEDATGQQHEVSLYHHTITGARGAMLDFVEIPDSLGTTTILKSKKIIWFDAGDGLRGSIQIKRKGISDFTYECAVNGNIIQDSMYNISPDDNDNQSQEVFELKVLTPVAASFGVGSSDVYETLVWYPIVCKRVRDNVSTVVHRRFRDFADVDESVRAAFQGHHMYSSLPNMPAKNSKILYDHADPAFQEMRREKLQTYIQKLVTVPRVLNVATLIPFLGISGNLIEYSVCFKSKSIGITIQHPSGAISLKGASVALAGAGFAGVVEVVKKESDGFGKVHTGDVVSKVNGMTTSKMSFKKLVQLVSTSPRPLMLHFLHASIDLTTQPLQAMAAEQATTMVDAAAEPSSRSSFTSDTVSEGVVEEESQFMNNDFNVNV